MREHEVGHGRRFYRAATRVANFKLNFKNNNDGIACPLCLVQPDSQSHCVQCLVVRENIDIRGEYEEIFTEYISKEISQTLMEIMKFRENMKMSPNGGPSAVHHLMLRTDASLMCICLI